MFLIDYNVKIDKMSKKQENIFIITFLVLMFIKIFKEQSMKLKYLLSLFIILLTNNVNAEDSLISLQKYQIIKRPLQYINVEKEANIDPQILAAINERSSKYVASTEYQDLKNKIDSKITEDEADCITGGNNEALCLGNKTQVTYEQYKIGNFIQGIIDEGMIDNKNLNSEIVFKALENIQNEEKKIDKNIDSFQPNILNLLDRQQVLANESFKQLASQCLGDNNGQTNDGLISCVLDNSYNYNNAFVNIISFCFSSSLVQQVPQEQISFIMNTCYNKNMQTQETLSWISQESYRMGSVFYEKNKKYF